MGAIVLNPNSEDRAAAAGLLVAVLVISISLLSFTCPAAEIPPSREAVVHEGWDALQFEDSVVDGIKVRIDPKLIDYSKDITKSVRLFIENKTRTSKVLADFDDRHKEIAGAVKDAIGVADVESNIRLARALLVESATSHPLFRTPAPELRVYVVRSRMLKDRLRGGLKLAGLSYDAKTDQATFVLTTKLGGDVPPVIHFPVLVNEDTEAGKMVSESLGALQVSRWPGVLLHEYVEAAIVSRLNPRDPYFRWFADGGANALAVRLLERYVDNTMAADFSISFDTSRMADQKRSARLRYWMGVTYEVDTAVTADRELNHLRYAWATYEMDRLIKKHGADFIKQVLDLVVERRPILGRHLVAAIQQVTKEDFDSTLRQYEDFEDRKVQLLVHLANVDKARKESKFDAAIAELLRAMELAQIDGYNAKYYGMAAVLLVQAGDEAAADELFKKQLAHVGSDGKQALKIQMIDAAWAARKPAKVYSVAEEVLAQNPDHIPSLSVRMARLATVDKDYVRAKVVAQRILAVVPDERSPFHRLARDMIIELDAKDKQ